MDRDGGQVRQVTADAPAKICVAWSPVADRLAYIDRANGWSNLTTLRSTGTDRSKVELGANPVEAISWAPDGRCLAIGFRSGQESRIRTVDLDGTAQDLPGGLAGSRFPQWIKNPASLVSFATAELSAPHPGSAAHGVQPHP